MEPSTEERRIESPTADAGHLSVRHEGEGQPIVLVHGTGVNSAFWGEVPRAFARSHRVWVYDRRGFGRSSGPVARDYESHTRDLIALLEDRVGEPAAVVGWSAGGIVALDVAVRRPDLVRALVLYETPFHAKRHPSPGLILTIVRLQVHRRLLRDPAGAARSFLRYVFDEGQGANALDRFSPELQAEIDRDARVALAEIDAGTGEHLSTASIASIRRPIVGVTGVRTSPMLRSSMRRLASILPAMSVRTLPGGHALHLFDPERFAREVDEAVPV